MSAPTTPPRCEPADPTQDGWHWVQRDGKAPEARRWRQSWQAWQIDDGETSFYGARYVGPVTPPDEVEALRAERDAAIARDRNASAAHAKRATDLWLVTEERDNFRAGTYRLIAERTTLRARVAALEAALLGIVREQQSEAQAGTGEYQRGYDDCIAAHADLARAALETKP